MKKQLSWEDVLNKLNYTSNVETDVRINLDKEDNENLPHFNKFNLNKYSYIYSNYTLRPNYIATIIGTIENISDIDNLIIVLSNGIHFERDAYLIRMLLESKGVRDIVTFSELTQINTLEIYRNKVSIMNIKQYNDNNIYDIIINRDKRLGLEYDDKNIVQITAVNHGIITIENGNGINLEREMYNALSSDLDKFFNGKIKINFYGDIGQIILIISKIKLLYEQHSLTNVGLNSLNMLEKRLVETYNRNSFPKNDIKTTDIIISKERRIDYLMIYESEDSMKLKIKVNSFNKKEESKERINSFEEEMSIIRDELVQEYKKIGKDKTTNNNLKVRHQLIEMIERANNCIK